MFNVFPKLNKRDMTKLRVIDFTGKFVAKKKTIDVIHSNDKVNYNLQMATLGRWTKDFLIDMGPTFVKIGQMASTRNDVFCEAFASELVSLQDDCPYREEFDAKGFFEEELQLKVSDIFENFDAKPFKTASIGQCHTATLVNGNKVVVKIQRPGVRQQIVEDLQCIEEVISTLSQLNIVTASDEVLFSDTGKQLLDETDYEKEADNAIKIRSNLLNEPTIIVPRVSRALSTTRILTMEYVPGDKVTDLKDNSQKQEAIRLINDCFMKQFLVDGVLHGDPHPGNLAYSDGKLVLYDFGVLIDISSIMQNNFDKVMLSVMQEDSKQLTDILIDAKLLIPTGNKADIVYFFDTLFTSVSKTRSNGDKAFDFNIKKSLEALQEQGYDDSNRPFALKTDAIYLGRAISLLDGVFRDIDADYDPIALIRPYVDEKVNTSNIEFDLTNLMQIPSKVQNINSSIISVEKSALSMKAKTDSIATELKVTKILVILLLIAIIF